MSATSFRRPRLAALLAPMLLLAGPALAAAPEAALGPGWALPFAGLLLSIVLGPMLAEHAWHARMGLIAAGWATLLLLPWALASGPPDAAGLAWHAVLLEYPPFVSLIFALFTVGGGIVVRGGSWGTPAGNTLLLATGTGLASVMGTTGAAKVLTHPLLRADAHRSRKVHLVVFFILLVANVGGSLTPLGDPPFFLGFLKGVPFFLPPANLLVPMLATAGLLLAAFWLLDRRPAAADPKLLTGKLARTLLTISYGSVVMGALTCIGNASNFMVHAIAARRGVGMSGFIGFMGWSLLLMLPPLLVVIWLFFR